MPDNELQDFLTEVRQPSRYLGHEVNHVRKVAESVRLHVALAFPDLYEIGTSHFGLQILYSLLNARQEIAAERIFAPDLDMQLQLRQHQQPLMSLESKRPLSKFNIIGFSLLSELNYTNVLDMLELANVPFRAAQRDRRHPLVIAGGPCMFNPEPVADFFDAIVVGDGEEAILSMADAWLAWKGDGNGDREHLLRQWQAISGVYIPAFYDVTYDAKGLAHTVARVPSQRRVRRAILSDLCAAPPPNAPIVPYGRPVHDRLRVEVARGCTRGCRFCQAGMIYRPVRERPVHHLVEYTARALENTGFGELSLLSLSTGDYTCIESLLTRLNERFSNQHNAISLPSLRMDSLSDEMIDLIRSVRKTGFTMAPEAGSQRLRNVINKNINQTEIFDTVRRVFAHGWRLIKLYFMIGLPTERAEDRAAIADLARELRRLRAPHLKSAPAINISVATYIPKAHTPFQWMGQMSPDEASAALDTLKAQIKRTGARFKWQDPRTSYIEGILSRGDRRLSHLLEAAHTLGCRFDGWSDHFNFDRWQDAMAHSAVDPAFYTARQRNLDEPLPWDHIDSGVNKAYLHQELARAIDGDLTNDCRQGECNRCGVCDFETIAPVIHEPEAATLSVAETLAAESGHTIVPQTLQITFAKTGSARFFGHLEMVNIFTRALKRCKVAVAFSQGFHPKPRIRFEDSLPVGMESLAEKMMVQVVSPVEPDSFVAQVNATLPPGLVIKACDPITSSRRKGVVGAVTYHIQRRQGRFEKKPLRRFADATRWEVEKPSPKRPARRVDLKTAVSALHLLAGDTLCMTLKPSGEAVVRPALVLSALFGFSPEEINRFRIVKQPSNHGGQACYDN
jgi:radical SAM family uncharacterized protein/radical SAM-linked protein